MSIWNNLGCKNCFVGVVILGFFLLALPTNTRAGAAPTRLVIGYASTTPRLMPLWMARDQGFFAKYGIESEPVLLRSGATLVTRLFGPERTSSSSLSVMERFCELTSTSPG